MPRLLDIAEFLVASWILGGDDERGEIPTTHGELDQALLSVAQSEACPGWVRDPLHFVGARAGLRCVELPEILAWGHRAHLLTTPHPWSQAARVQIGRAAARKLIVALTPCEGDARTWGAELRHAVDDAWKASTAIRR